MKIDLYLVHTKCKLEMVDFISKYGHPFTDDTREKVGVIVYDTSGQLLMVQGKGGKVSLPKGGRLRGETELEGALREAWEETGIDLEKLAYSGKIKLIWGTYFIYNLDVKASDLNLRPQPGEVLKVVWKKPSSFWINEVAMLNCDLASYIRKISQPAYRLKK